MRLVFGAVAALRGPRRDNSHSIVEFKSVSLWPEAMGQNR